MHTPCHEDAASNENLDNHVPYQEAVGSLMYLITGTRPDIAFAVSKAAHAFHQPTKSNWSNVKKIFKYLKGTASHSITYKKV